MRMAKVETPRKRATLTVVTEMLSKIFMGFIGVRLIRG